MMTTKTWEEEAIEAGCLTVAMLIEELKKQDQTLIVENKNWGPIRGCMPVTNRVSNTETVTVVQLHS